MQLGKIRKLIISHLRASTQQQHARNLNTAALALYALEILKKGFLTLWELLTLVFFFTLKALTKPKIESEPVKIKIHSNEANKLWIRQKAVHGSWGLQLRHSRNLKCSAIFPHESIDNKSIHGCTRQLKVLQCFKNQKTNRYTNTPAPDVVF